MLGDLEGVDLKAYSLVAAKSPVASLGSVIVSKEGKGTAGEIR